MATTSVHFPPDLAERLDRAARRKDISRNKLIVCACEQYLKTHPGHDWPEGFFDSGLTEDELRELRRGVDEMTDTIAKDRRSSTRSPF